MTTWNCCIFVYYVYDTGDTNIKMRRTKWQQEDSAYNLLSFSVAIYEVYQYVFSESNLRQKSLPDK